MNAIGWHPIQDLSTDWLNQSSSELTSLASIWKEQSGKLRKSDALRQFNARLNREWAIETGIIENLYSIDRGVTQILIERGIEESLVPHGTTDRPANQVVSILKDQQEALEGLFDYIKENRSLTTSYIKELHQLITRHQTKTQGVDTFGNAIELDLLRGDWKRLPNNPTRRNGTSHEYCPPEQVASEMDRLIDLHLEHERKGTSPEIEAAWLHHRFTQIHPFQDGNGRVARTLASLAFIRAGWFPLVINRDRQSEYISACEEADAENLSELIDLFVSIQKKSFVKALSISENVLHEKEPIQQVILASAEKLRQRKRSELDKYRVVFSIANDLEDYAFERLSTIRQQLIDELSPIESDIRSTVVRNNRESAHWYKNQIVKIANELDYFADTGTYASWIRLKIVEGRQAELIFSFHSLGVEFLGVMAVTAFIEYRESGENEVNQTTIDGPYRLCEELFQFSYIESYDVASERFAQWFNQCVLTGLDQWRRQL